MKFVRTNCNSHFRSLKRSQICGLICFALLSGCNDKVGAPVNVDAALTALESVMESWKDGKTPEDLLNESPAIVVQDAEWNDGVKLLDYQIVNDDSPAGPNLITTVKLKLSKVDGTVTEKTATYVVGTRLKLTVYRNLMR